MRIRILLLLISILGYGYSFAQPCGGVLTSSESSICDGESVTLSIEPTSEALTTTLDAGNDQNGNMFDVTAFKDVIITGFDVSNRDIADYEIYYKVGTYLGFETMSSAWTLLGSSTNLPAVAPGAAADSGIPLSLSIPSGQTYSFYTTISSGATQNYTNGTDEAAEVVNDGNLRVTEGIGIEYPFGTQFRPRIFNGRVKYHFAQTYLWSDGSTGTTLTTSPSQSTLIGVTGTCDGGATFESTKDITVSSAVVDVTATQTSVCNGESTTLSAVTTVNTSISTAFDSNNGSDGNMFDVEAINDLTIKSIDVSYTGVIDADYEIYGKSGTFDGFEADASAWTLLGSATLTQEGDAIPLPIGLNVVLSAGDTYAIYVSQQREQGNNHRYTNGTSVGDPLVEDANLRLREGIGLLYPFGDTFSPRNFNGRIHYEAKSSANLTWSTGAIAGSIVVTPTIPTNYTVTSISSVGNCESTGNISILQCMVDIEDAYENYEVSLFPNPSTDYLNLTIDGLANKNIEMAITNLQGQVMASENLNNVTSGFNQQIDLSGFSNGLYFIRLSLEGETSVHKFSVLK